MDEKLNKPLVVLIGLITYINEYTKHMAALNILNENLEKEENHFLRIVHETTSCYLLLEIVKIFDSANFRENSNCSINKIRELCLEDSNKFPKGEEDVLIKKIDELKSRCETAIPKYIRNKRLAHNDLDIIFSGEYSSVSANDVQSILQDLVEIIAEITERLIGNDLKLGTIEEYMDYYRKEFNKLKKSEVK